MKQWQKRARWTAILVSMGCSAQVDGGRKITSLGWHPPTNWWTAFDG